MIPEELLCEAAARSCEAYVAPLSGKLTEARFDAHRGFQALAGCLPVADVVHQLVHMAVKPLLALHAAPDLDAALDEPFHHEGRFIVPAAQAVKHEHQKDVELPGNGVLLNLLDRVPVLSGDLEFGGSLF